jgi:ppGpp synthetase/RelA/SpoT-type nucleotidyltranferase
MKTDIACTGNQALTGCRTKEGTMEIDPVWHKNQINMYVDEFPHYEVYAQVLERILKRACELYAPLAIVQTRAKSVSSFGEKAIRKAYKYKCPVVQITDLCGARVITQTQEEANEICEFIKTNFIVDEANSLDVRTRLKETEFGYLSVHYVVQIKDSDFLREIFKEGEFGEIGERKAEIQVRTILQHAWADITHDRLYKSEFKVPQVFHREGAMQAAALENADGEFARFIRDFDAYTGSYSAYMTKEKIGQEIATLKLVLRNEPANDKKPEIALRIARIARAAGDYRTIGKVLRKFDSVKNHNSDFIRMELGHALCQINQDSPRSKDYKRGQALLEHVAESAAENLKELGPGKKQDRNILATAKSLLAWSYANIPGEEYKARDLYREALDLAPSNPYYLAALLEFEICCTRNQDFAGPVRPTLLAALETCRTHADLGIELPRAFFTMGKIHLLMGQHYEALGSYAKGVHLCLSKDVCIPDDTFDSELKFLSHINPGKRQLPFEHEWVRRLLLLGKSLKISQDEVSKEIKGLVKWSEFQAHVLIVVGGTDETIKQEIIKYKDYLEAALSGFEGTVISGGTKAGIPGIVGDVAEALNTKGAKKFIAVGYLPKNLPDDGPKDLRYDNLIITDGHTLSLLEPIQNWMSPLEPIQNWIDILCAGIKPADVKVLGINGGKIAAFEYQLALALGATVGVVDYSGRAVSDLLSASDWLRSGNLLQLPNDVATVRAFVTSGITRCSPDILEKREDLAKRVHKKYLKDNKRQVFELSMLPWSLLPDSLKESCRQQIDYVEQILGKAGYAVRKKDKSKIKYPKFAESKVITSEVEIMAEMEHGRWNVERLKDGWKRGEPKDVSKKISPYLVPWKDLPDKTKEYDRKAVREWPIIFKAVGLEIYRV